MDENYTKFMPVALRKIKNGNSAGKMPFQFSKMEIEPDFLYFFSLFLIDM